MSRSSQRRGFNIDLEECGMGFSEADCGMLGENDEDGVREKDITYSGKRECFS